MATVPAAHGLHQAGHAQQRIAAQFQRIAEAVVQAAHDHVHRLQAGQRLQIDAVVAHRQVGAFDQRKAPVAGQEGVLEIGLVVRSRRQQHDARIVALAGAEQQRVALDVEEARQLAHVALAEDVGQDARAHQPVFQRVADAGGRLRAIGDHPPAAIGRARQVRGVGVQIDAAAAASMPKQGRRKCGLSNSSAGGKMAIVDAGAAARRDRASMALSSVARWMTARSICAHSCRVDDQRNRIHRPGALLALRIAADVVGDAVGLDELLAGLPAAAELAEAHARRWRRRACASGGAGSRRAAALRPSGPPRGA